MPTLQEILQDPNYVNANPATKQAIFERWAPQDTNFSSANGATQAAIRQRFGVGFAVEPELKQPKDEGFFTNIGKLAYEGGERAIGAAKVSPSVISGDVGKDKAALIAEQLAMEPSVQPKELTEVTTAFKDEAEALKKAKGFTESVGPTLQFMAEFGKQALTNPKGVAYLTAQSAANMAPSILGMIAGGKAGAAVGTAVTPGVGTAIGGVGGAIAGGFAGSAPMEIGAEFIDNVGKELGARGLKPTQENVEALLSDKAFVEKAVSEARTKGTTTAAVDAAMTAGAGRYATGPRRAAIKAAQQEMGAAAKAADVAKRAEEILKQGTKVERAGRAVKRGAGAVGIDVAGGGASEAAGQYAAYGEIDPESVALEMLGELGGAGIEVPSAAYATGKDALKAQAKKQAEKILEQERAAQEPAPPIKPAAREEQEMSLEDLERAAGITSVREEPQTVEDLIAQDTTTKTAQTPAVTEPAPQAAVTTETPATTEYVSPLESIRAREEKAAEPAAPAAEETPQQRFDRLSKMRLKVANAFRDGIITNQEFEKFQADLDAAREAAKSAPVDLSQLSPAKREILELADKIEAAGQKGFADGMRGVARPEAREPDQKNMEFYREKLAGLLKTEAVQAGQEKIEQAAYGLPEFFADTPKDADRIAGLRKSGPTKVRIALDEINDTIQTLADTIAAAGYRIDQVSPGQVPPAILRIKSQIGTLAAGANRLSSSAEAVQKGYKRADPKRVKADIEAALADITKAEELIAAQPNVPTAAEQMEGVAVPPSPEVQDLQEQRRKAEEDIKRLRGRGMSLWTALAGKLTGEEVRGLGGRSMQIGKNQFLNLKAKKGKPSTDLSTLVANGELNEFLPLDKRPNSNTFDEQESTEYIREKLASGDYTSYETQRAIEDLDPVFLDIERRIQEELSLEDINREIQVASDEQREADQAVADFASEGETGAAAERKAQEATELDDLEKRAADAGIDVDAIREQAYYDTRGEEDAMYERTLADRLRGALDAQEQFLAIQTEKDLKAKEELRKAKEKAEQERKRADEEKAKADEAAADFVLTGSDRAADQAAARGQMELAPAEEPTREERFAPVQKLAEKLLDKGAVRYEDVEYEGKPYQARTRTFEGKLFGSELRQVQDAIGNAKEVTLINQEDRVMTLQFTGKFVGEGRNVRIMDTQYVPTESDEQALETAEKGQVGYSPDPEEQRVEKELTGKTMLQAADWAIQNAPNAFLKTIAEKVRNRLRDLERRGVKLEFQIYGGDRRPGDLYGSRGYMQPDWGNDTKGTTLRLVLNGAAVLNNQAGYPPGTRYSTVLHELLHVATRGYLQFAPLSDPLRRQMRDLTNAIVDRFNSDAKAGKLPPVMQKYYKRINNVLESDDEVLAWGLTDEEVQKYFADIKVGEKSVMTRLVELVRSVLGLGKQYESALDRLVKVSESMLDMDVSTIDAVLGAAGKRLGRAAPTTGEQQALFQREGRTPQTETSAFKRWTKGLNVIEADFAGTYNGGPAVFQAFHGTTHDDIEEFKTVGSKEGALGQGPYFSTSIADVNENYAGVGPDLTNRIGREEDSVRDGFYDDPWFATDVLQDYFASEGIDIEVTDDNFEDLKDEYGDKAITHAATARLKGKSDGLVMPVYVRLEKPFNMATNPTYFEMTYPVDEDGEPDYDAEPEGSAMELINAIDTVAGQYDADASGLTSWVYENAVDGISAREVWDRAAKEITDLNDDNGDLISSGQFMQDVAREMGFDGLIQDADLYFGTQRRGFGGVRAGAMKGVKPGTLHIMPFSGKQVKSATGNRGTFDPNDPNILRQQEGRENIIGEVTTGNWTLQPNTKLDTKDSLIYKLLDKNIDLKRVIQAIKGTGREIATRWNPYLQEELYHGRTAKQTQDFMSKEVKPLIEEMDKNGVTIGEFEQYLHNRHAEAYNKHVAKVNPGRPEMQDGGSGIKTEDAQKYLADLPEEKRRVYEKLADRIDSITAGTRELLVKSGLEKQEIIDAWEKTFPDYVPLMREEGDFNYTTGSFGVGKGFDVRGSFSKRAMGSKRNVVDILANTVMARENAIVKAEKNRVAQAVYGLAVQNGNPDFWMAVNPMGEKVPLLAVEELQNMGIDPTSIEFLMKEPRQRALDPKKNEVISRINATLRNNDNVLSMRLNGENRYVFFNPNNERAKRAATALKNLDAQQLGTIMGYMSRITRYMSAINTQYNPIFGAYNFLRDVQGAAFQLSTTPIAGKQKEVGKNVLPAMKAIFQSLRKGEPADTEMGKLWNDFQKAGGQTGFRDMYSRSQDRAEALLDEFKKMSEGRIKKAGRYTFQLLSDYNDTMENAVRLSAYKVALENGFNKDEAASIAKNLTVNFNRKGEIAVQAGALYAFFNASMQGSARLYETLKGPLGKKIVYGGLLWGVMQSALLAMAGFDEEEPPEFVRERNFIIPIFGTDKYLAFPMPLGYHVIPGFSRSITDAVLNYAGVLKSSKTMAERVKDLTGMFLEAFNPIGNAGWSFQTLAFTPFDPIVALFENKDWTGKKIYKEDFSDRDPTPGYTRARDSATYLGTQIAKFLNLATGGTKYQPGIVSPTPEQLEYLAGQAFGGVGREVGKIMTTTEKLITGEELPPYKIPLAGRFYGETKSSAAEASRFYKNLQHLNKLENEIKGRRGNKEPMGTFMSDNPEARLIQRAESVYSDVKKLRERKNKLVERGASRESVKVVEEQITRKMRLLNEQVENAKK